MVFRLILITIVMTGISYYYSYRSYQTEALSYLEKYVVTRGVLESAPFKQAEANTKLIRDAWLHEMERIDASVAKAEFSDLMQKDADGVWRLRPQRVDLLRLPTLNVLPHVRLDDAFLKSFISANHVVSAFGPAYRNQIYDTYIDIQVSDANVTYIPGVNYAGNSSRLNLEENLETELGATPERNPSRTTFWTAVYFDKAAKRSMVSVITPVDFQGRFVGGVGHDVLIDDLIQRTLDTVIPGTYNLMMARNGQVIAHPRHSNHLAQTSVDPELKSIYDAMQSLQAGTTFVETADQKNILGIANIEPTGWFFITVYPKHLLTTKASDTASQILILGGLTLLIEVFILGALVSKHIGRPLGDMINATRNVYNTQARAHLDTQRNDELGRLGKAFVEMADEITFHREHLENQVSQRTADLTESNAALRQAKETAEQAKEQALQTLEQLKTAQAQMVQAEKMAALGLLVSNVAHEINTPIGAVKSSGAFIADTLHAALEKLPPLLDVLEPEPRHLFVQLIEQTRTQFKQLSTREERALTKKMTADLEQLNVKDASIKAKLMMKFGVHDHALDYLPLLNHPRFELIHQVSSYIAGIISGAHNINTAVEKVNRIVYALKALSGYDQANELTIAPLYQGIDKALAKFQNQTHAVEMVCNYQPDLEPVRADHNALQQVWTHLLMNALQAMNYSGKLVVDLSKTAAEFKISITDSGTGIAPEHMARIFEPFFTTRTSGEGSGMGLAIVKRIIENHHGRVEVHTEPDAGTTLNVYLPLSITQPT